MPDDDDSVRIIADEIARYLRDHPDAADSLDGITRWWLARQRYEDAAAKVQHALDLLVEQGVLIRTALPDGGVLYVRNS